MIDERIDLLDLINVRLAESVANNDINENEIITIINEMSVVKYYRIIAHEKRY